MVRRQDRDSECRELIDGVVSEELGVPGVITPPLYRRIGAEPNVNTTASTGMLGMSFLPFPPIPLDTCVPLKYPSLLMCTTCQWKNEQH